MICYRCEYEGQSAWSLSSKTMQMEEVCPQCEAPVDLKAVKPQAAPAAKPIAKQPTDILGAARARLVELEAELAAYRDKQQEAAMLRRMIAAAEGHDLSILKIVTPQVASLNG